MRESEIVYRKVGRKYVSCGYNNIPELSDGIWLIKSHDGGGSQTSVFWRVGDMKRPVDIVTHAALQSISDDLSQYLVKLGDVNSKEYLEAKEIIGGRINGGIQYSNASASEVASLFLRRIAIHLEDGVNMSWDSLQLNFREESQLHTKQEFNDGVKVLYQFTEWLNKNGIKFRNGNNIG